jgi:spore maturation protein CgeB
LHPAFAAFGRRSGGVDGAQIAGELAAGEKRLSLVNALGAAGVAGGFAIDVWGDSGWQAVTHGVRHRGVAGHFFDLTKIYGAARINLDIGRLYQMDIVTMRVFDVLACGGFLLTERAPAVAELFTPGEDLDVFSGAEELCDKVRFYLARPELAARIAAHGRATVLRQHTVAQRLAVMLAALPADGEG